MRVSSFTRRSVHAGLAALNGGALVLVGVQVLEPDADGVAHAEMRDLAALAEPLDGHRTHPRPPGHLADGQLHRYGGRRSSSRRSAPEAEAVGEVRAAPHPPPPSALAREALGAGNTRPVPACAVLARTRRAPGIVPPKAGLFASEVLRIRLCTIADRVSLQDT